MKLHQYAITITASFITFISVSRVNSITQAQSATSTTFFCKLISGIPNTVARVKSINNDQLSETSEKTISVLKWTRKYYPESQEYALNRCVRVSAILQNYKTQNTLSYIIRGNMYGKPVICATSSQGSPCSRLLFVLEPSEDSAQVVKDLRKIIDNPLSNKWKPPIQGRIRGGGSR
ncbi:COP23 domain-containing protein [uncultured Nostoc sp.]|uniref:COP23 domain-containing protein n=1 Tax=uncultured Nostoc sp. TaxID=340711 RepID=UPI0016858A52|nr:hypothetical protein [Nostoc sp. FACHB-973]